jgi:hypothetical protein
MARGKTLLKLLNDVRAEARLSLNPAMNIQTRDAHVNLIQREQERLWEDFAWPHLRVHRYLAPEAGQRYFDPLAAINEAGDEVADLTIDRVERVEVKSDGVWLPLYPGIGPEHYAAHDSALDQRSWPPRRWALSEDDEIEIWPVPDQDATPADQNGMLRLTGIRSLRPLVEDSDVADLDDRMLVLFCAGSLLAASQAADAQMKLEAASRHYGRLKGSLTKTGSFNMFGTTEREKPRRPRIGTYKPPVVY